MKQKKLIGIVLLGLCLLLCACGRTGEQGNTPSQDWIAAYVPSEIPYAEGLTHFSCNDAAEDRLCFGDFAGGIFLYDTQSGQWQQLHYDSAALPGRATARGISAKAGTVWALLEVGTPQGTAYTVFRCDTVQGDTGTLAPVEFEGGESTEADGLFFFGIYALNGEQALLYDMNTAYVIDEEARQLAKMEATGVGFGSRMRAGEETLLYAFRQEGDGMVYGCYSFDPETLELGPLRELEFSGLFVSEPGRWLCTVDGVLCEVNPDNGEVRQRIFPWMDAALCANDLGGFFIYENSAGDFYYPGEQGLVKVSAAQVKPRETLTLGCFGHTGGAMAAAWQMRGYDMSAELLDAVIRFNNTNPDYKIEIRPLQWETEAERSRLLMELATGSGIDLIDTSGLPENCVDSALLVDLLPYIDADPELSREDFIQPLLQAMTKNGALYELSIKFTLLTFATRPTLFPGKENWTPEAVLGLAADHPEATLFSMVDRDYMLDMLAKMASAEFIDWENGTCRFDSEDFRAWLQFVRELPYNSEYSNDPQLLVPSYDAAAQCGYTLRFALKSQDYVFAGFPGTGGSYFIRLGTGPDEYRSTLGSGTRVGIMAASGRQDAAWQFVRLLLTRMREGTVDEGIPVLQSAFEAALANTVNDQTFGDYDSFNTQDAALLRELVSSTEKLARPDEALLTIIKSEAEAYFTGQRSLEDTAALIQSRVSLYVAEQSA